MQSSRLEGKAGLALFGSSQRTLMRGGVLRGAAVQLGTPRRSAAAKLFTDQRSRHARCHMDEATYLRHQTSSEEVGQSGYFGDSARGAGFPLMQQIHAQFEEIRRREEEKDWQLQEAAAMAA